MNTARRSIAPARAAPDDYPQDGAARCETRHKPLQALCWRLFGGFVAILVTLALAGSAQLASKANEEDVQRIESRTHDLEKTLATMQSELAELGAGQRHIHEDLTYVRKLLDEEKRK